MTLAELIDKAHKVQSSYTSAWIPLKYKGKDVEIDLVKAGNFEEGYEVNLIIEQ